MDGWLRTGDVGHMDEDGYVFLVDRIKDLIICSGFNVYPRTIEEALLEHPAVDETNVIGVPDEYRGEAPVAFVKLKAGQTRTEQRAEEIPRRKAQQARNAARDHLQGPAAQDADRQAQQEGAARGICPDERGKNMNRA